MDIVARKIESREPESAPQPFGPSWGDRLVRHRVILAASGLWLAGNVWVLVTADALPFDWPTRAGRTVSGHVVDANLALAWVPQLSGDLVHSRHRLCWSAPHHLVQLPEIPGNTTSR